MPCFGKTYCYISKTIHSVPVFRRFLLWSRDIPNMGVVRDFWRKRESNKHGKLWCSLDFRNQKKKRFWDFLSNRIVVKFIPPKPPTEPPPSFQPPQRQLTAVAPDFFVPWLLFTWKIRDSPAISLSLVFNSQFHTKYTMYLASKTNQNARFYSIMRFYAKCKRKQFGLYQLVPA